MARTSPDLAERAAKIQKMEQNGAEENGVLLFLKVKKLSENAILPCRGSALAAGYDLSRFLPLPRLILCPFYFIFFLNLNALAKSFDYIFFPLCCWISATSTKVPARGKALVPTDLSIAIPEGTYARIGNSI